MSLKIWSDFFVYSQQHRRKARKHWFKVLQYKNRGCLAFETSSNIVLRIKQMHYCIPSNSESFIISCCIICGFGCFGFILPNEYLIVKRTFVPPRQR